MAVAPDDKEIRRTVTFPEMIPDPHDDLPTPEELRALFAEWTHDYGLRHMEVRGVKYEDAIERKLDHAAARKAGDQPLHPWPSEIAEANRRKQLDKDQGKNSASEKANGRDTGHSM